jgi:hypothetical protein
MDWKCDSSILALQAQSPEFKPQFYQNKKQKMNSTLNLTHSVLEKNKMLAICHHF